MRRLRLSVRAIKLLSNIVENSKSLVVRTDYHIQTPCRIAIVARTPGGAVPRPMITGHDSFRFRWMWRFRNIAGGVLATLLLGAAFGASPIQASKACRVTGRGNPACQRTSRRGWRRSSVFNASGLGEQFAHALAG